METNAQSSIDTFGLPIVEIDSTRNYWLVRTNAGAYFDEFYIKNFIAIGWNECKDFTKFREEKKNDNIAQEIEGFYPKEQSGRIYGQIHRFSFEMQIGDIVMIPSENSSFIRFGVIVSDPYIREVSATEIDEGSCPYIKTRNVEWIKIVEKSKLDPYLFRMMQSHQTINNANDYAHYIDRTLHNFFMKEGKAYLVLRVEKQGDIPAFDLVNFVNGVIDLVPVVNELPGIKKEYEKDDLDLKLNVQSPGFTEFFSNAPQLIVGIGLLIVVLTGSKVKVKTKKTDDSSTEINIKGLLGDNLLKKADELEKLKNIQQENFTKIKAELPEELKSLLEKDNRED